METFGVNYIKEEKKAAFHKSLRMLALEAGIIFIIVTNVIFVLNYFKIIDLRLMVGSYSGSTQSQ